MLRAGRVYSHIRGWATACATGAPGAAREASRLGQAERGLVLESALEPQEHGWAPATVRCCCLRGDETAAT